jgi:D-alanyl-D-alanine carboxypeptidase
MKLSHGHISAAGRINGQLRSTATDFPVDALFPIYSITKTLTAICVLRLAELGTFSLDDTARQWLPEVNVPATITLTHLLRHTSGLSDYGPLPEYHQAVRAHPDRPWSRQQFLDAVLPKGLLATPGGSWAYSNVGYMLLIDILERVTGRTFARILTDFVTKPLALRHTSVLEHIEDLMECVPGFGSEVSADGEVVDVRGRYHPGWCAPRLVASTVEEITHVFDALIAGAVLAPDTLAQMLTLVPLPEPRDSGMAIGGGMGVYSDRGSRHGRNYHHGGGGPGYDLAATVYPDTPIGRVSIAVFVNSSCGPPSEERSAALLDQLLDGPC